MRNDNVRILKEAVIGNFHGRYVCEKTIAEMGRR